MNKITIKEINGLNTINELINHLNNVKHNFKNDKIKIILEHSDNPTQMILKISSHNKIKDNIEN